MMTPAQLYRKLAQLTALTLDNTQVINLATDIVYVHLFDMDATELRAYFDLPANCHDETIRDEMGIDALRAIAECETMLGVAMMVAGMQTGATQLDNTWKVMQAIAPRYRRDGFSVVSNIDKR